MAAMELFAKKGFRGTTTRDLAAHADVNEAIIFRHFKTQGGTVPGNSRA